MATSRITERIGRAVMKAGADKASTWFTPHMVAASRAIFERIPSVDFTLEVRDARIPISSEYEHMRYFPSCRRIIILNKMDLANRSQTQEWIKHFQKQDCICYGINSHNKDNIKELLKFLQAQVREVKFDQSKFTTTMMLVGVPNVGKSALANSLHQIGRISAAEKGKLKHTIVSPEPGETKVITSLKIASHPNIYILDTPGVLLPDSLDIEVGSKLALTGAIKDCLVEECELAQYFLTILNLSDEHKRWETLVSKEDGLSVEHKANLSDSSDSNMKRKKLFYSDHTQDFVVRDVRRTLLQTFLSFKGNLEDVNELVRLIDSQLVALRDAFRVSLESGEDGCQIVATKLLNLYRTGRLGCYTLDTVPRN
ncbi:hypothetical protein AQUCO_04400123v1 [Aquilegia coerulea]|uniref:CP-type G domain-containing protein n=1 Tax=Aquilegia coerulea TaxID=218851 RepID=A0A2G5CN55_AQUCA|nr:hypothetical protein AQUCO_04400123v1 [Aquilegia coerulea]